MVNAEKDRYFMNLALDEARKAFDSGEVPVGCAIVRDSEIIALSGNNRESKFDPTGHAEMIALRTAGEKIGSRSLENCTIYVTLEPCPMCMSAIMLARIRRLVFGARDPKMGAVSSEFNLAQEPAFCHSIIVSENILGNECSALINRFFENLRTKK